MAELDPIFLDSLTYPAKDLRKILKDIFTEGILTSGALAVSQHSTPAMSVDVALGRALIESDEGNYGTYLVENDALVTKTIAASDPSNPRIDRVIAQIYDATDISGDTTNVWAIEVLTGTPAASPAAPALPDNALDLALVAVAAGVTSIVNANITNQRTIVGFQTSIYKFGAFPETPSSAPTTNYQVANKKYIDDEIDKEGLYSTTVTSSATPTPARASKRNMFTVTALAEAATFAAPSGTPADGDTLLIRIKDNSTARALSWNAIYRGSTELALPSTTTLGKTIYIVFVYNSADSKWDLIDYRDGI